MKEQGTHNKASQYVELISSEAGDLNIVTHATIARKRLCENVPKVTLSKIGHPLLVIKIDNV
jgi:hypothetical protein